MSLVDIIVVSFPRETAQQSVLGFLFWGQFRIVTCYNFLIEKEKTLMYSGSLLRFLNLELFTLNSLQLLFQL